jgi:phosphatidylcholine synthase
VFVPTLVVWRGLLVPESWMVVVAGAMLLASGYGFSRADAKTADHAFTGFPSYWNLVVFYLYLMHLSPITNAIVLLALAVMVFVPLRYVYPSRMPRLRALTNTLGALWGVVLLAIVWQLPSISPVLLWGSLLYPVYYFALSAALYI